MRKNYKWLKTEAPQGNYSLPEYWPDDWVRRLLESREPNQARGEDMTALCIFKAKTLMDSFLRNFNFSNAWYMLFNYICRFFLLMSISNQQIFFRNFCSNAREPPSFICKELHRSSSWSWMVESMGTQWKATTKCINIDSYQSLAGRLVTTMLRNNFVTKQAS
jgi:hypothetical protein